MSLDAGRINKELRVSWHSLIARVASFPAAVLLDQLLDCPRLMS